MRLAGAAQQRGRRQRERDERGMVTAESALVLPIITAFVMTLVWLLSVGFAQVRVIDAARDAARAMARGESVDDARNAALDTAPDAAEVAIGQGPSTVQVTVTARAEPPGWLLVPLPAITLHANAEVEVEDAATR